ncbi:GNAT family N-acetyltransferase [Kitasatospora sp. NBC_01266]|uniref:GNAT family N-acetyltransferase n=1 Tax=Kitasatospora sp. NBC_01266 TaxID=2903572 RepID=UPI002E3158F3|nr:GNAT family N-acetyltransferase [Kitasatospora sp. NBC_01266]
MSHRPLSTAPLRSTPTRTLLPPPDVPLPRHGRPRTPARWFLPEQPGPGTLAAHVLLTGRGSLWTDQPAAPRVAVAACGPYRVLRGDPRLLPRELLAPLERGQFSAPDRFLPLLGRSFSTVTPWVRLVCTQQHRPRRRPVPAGVRLRPLTRADADLLDATGAELRWVTETWGSSRALASSGGAWGAFVDGRLVALAAGHLRGLAHEDLAVATVPEFRRAGLGLACVLAAATAVRHRGKLPSWTAPRSNGPSLALAEAAGFRPVREELAYWVGPAV